MSPGAREPHEMGEGEPKQVVFEILIHLKEGTKDGFLGELAGELTPERKYVSNAKRWDADLPPLNLKGGRSLKVMGQMAGGKGISLVGMKWRDDIEPQRDGTVSKGVAILLQFGVGKSDFVDGEALNKWKALSKRVFEDFVWSADYHKAENKIGLFGPTRVVARTDGSSVANETGSQLVLKCEDCDLIN
ncbi:MAG: hypothetical protein UW41_C0016G0008 [Candidatus Collierbacteria bacterium GW2011_GWC2_44_18]|uniref:Uncharacterized protein n=2 Tax=Microgenomates group TaxID=1794810 RepID=A0A0G1M2Z2_9BACT|nr:MAG: hypothetical protein UW41_C0016G0008 [Candidatus Collierbacteria bacterium GW2011_GWC2_44_18]KKT66294.1 MAG: hypothetical protein UW60_C0026G0010 [Candidatus Woesebacteria bacterium GW2011_GWA2_44_33]